MRIVRLTKDTKKDLLNNLLKRSPNNYGQYEAAVAEIIGAVREKGDAALFSYTEKFDKCKMDASNIKVTAEEIEEAYGKVDAGLVEVMQKSWPAPIRLNAGSKWIFRTQYARSDR